MRSRPMSIYLWLALVVAGISVVASALILVLGIAGTWPFATSGDPLWNRIASISNLSAATSGIFALMVGAIAIIAVIVAERAETRAIEQLKVDISRLWMVLHTVRNRSLLYTNPKLINDGLDIFAAERQTLQDILSGPTGFSIYVWQARQQDKAFHDFTSGLAGLINLLTLALGTDRTALFNSIAIRADKLSRLIAQITDANIADMAAIIGKLGSGLSLAQTVASSDEISHFIHDMDQGTKSRLDVPTAEEVEAAAQAAQRAIGGEAGSTVRHFGAKAMTGNVEEVATWHHLIAQLLQAQPNSTPEL